MKTQTKLGELIGTPHKRVQVVKYKGHLYYASEEDIRHIIDMVLEHFLDRIISGEFAPMDEVTQLVKSEMGIEVYQTHLRNGKLVWCKKLVNISANGRMYEIHRSADFLDVNYEISMKILSKKFE